MSRLSHPNIVRLLAVVTTSEPFAIITEYMDKGDLSVYLQEFEIEAPNARDATQGNFIRYFIFTTINAPLYLVTVF